MWMKRMMPIRYPVSPDAADVAASGPKNGSMMYQPVADITTMRNTDAQCWNRSDADHRSTRTYSSPPMIRRGSPGSRIESADIAWASEP